ncbi:DUF438 domain-containing protein [Intestinibaculum porci]|uniref:DUF438 domain-containing protein n=1 Tax=Intestinibaculum porci TaxID=2487118 RepID=UPI00240A6E84|nr:DUF438 domain-containing protein [Intestinibaculum porci]MDD6350260.1 DUF438 domain-containing protein [Intestinibaculum porci]
MDSLKTYIERLNQGEALEDVQKDFREHFSDVAAIDIAEAEQAMINEGMSVKEVQKLCDVHSALFHGADRKERILNAEREVRRSMLKREVPQEMKSALSAIIVGHPLNILTHENKEIQKRLDHLAEAIENNQEAIPDCLQDLALSHVHFDKKDELILPLLKRHNIAGPADVMWNVDVELRRTNKALQKNYTLDQVKAYHKRMQEMLFKEEKILFPLADEQFSLSEWQSLSLDFPRFGYAYLKDIPQWKDAITSSTSESVEEGLIHLPTGTLSLKQVKGILDALPVELTFIDDQDINRYVSEETPLFTRPLSSLGHHVYECHPPVALPMVKTVMTKLKNGEDMVSIKTEKKGHPVLVRYIAVRDEAGTYLGVLEAVEDLSDIL